ncbi:MAG TPA: hypothetical protein VNR38_06140 [Ureibacillus sp.]|nr:hypothetical protein [Ureibacillus sp.]
MKLLSPNVYQFEYKTNLLNELKKQPNRVITMDNYNQTNDYLNKSIIPPSTYERFKDGIFAVEEAFLTASKRLQLMSLVSLCEGLVNHILELQSIPLSYVQDESKKWLNFCEKLETFLLVNSSCPLKKLSEYQIFRDIYQKILNLVVHGNPDVRVKPEHIESLKVMANNLLKYDIERINM